MALLISRYSTELSVFRVEQRDCAFAFEGDGAVAVQLEFIQPSVASRRESARRSMGKMKRAVPCDALVSEVRAGFSGAIRH